MNAGTSSDQRTAAQGGTEGKTEKEKRHPGTNGLGPPKEPVKQAREKRSEPQSAISDR